jgi:NADH-quinone oxidoreductase subunit N
LIYYVITYALAAIGAFGILSALERERVDRLADFAGLSRRAPLLSFCMLIFLLSLAGIPPLAGFLGKFFVFFSALYASPNMLWLVILAVATSAVSLYYYLKVLKQIYVPEAPAGAGRIEIPWSIQTTIGFIALLLVLLGCFPNLLLVWIDRAVRAIPR